jgi:outer membrane protein assembly factor BamB
MTTRQNLPFIAGRTTGRRPGDSHRKACPDRIPSQVRILLFLFLLVGLLTATVAANPGWKFRSDLSNSGVYDDGGKRPAGDLIWTFKTGHVVRSSPAVVNGIIFFGGNDGFLYACNASTGALLWKFAAELGIQTSPAVVGVVVYAGGWNGNLYALDASTGALLWNYTTGDGVISSPAVADGVVYAGSNDDNLYALNASTGALLWKYTTGDDVHSSPAVADGAVYIGSDDNNLYALNASTGALLWKYTTGDDVSSSPAVADGTVYIGSDDHNLYALNASTGALLWKYTTGDDVRSSPAVVNGVVYAGSYDHNLYAFNASTGALLWDYSAGDEVYSSPAVANGVVYAGSLTYDGKSVHALDASIGALLWDYSTTSGSIFSSPVVANGMVYIGCDDGNLYAFGTFPDQPPESVTGLHATSMQQLRITWAWTDPVQIGFSHVLVYLNGVFQGNVTKGAQTWTATGLAPLTTYTIGTRTVGARGGANGTWVNDTVTTSALSLSYLDPAEVQEGSPAFTLYVYGTGFTPDSTILWNGGEQATEYIDSGHLGMEVPQELVAHPRHVNITVSDGSSGELSNSLFLPVTDKPTDPKAWKFRSDLHNIGVYDDGGKRPEGILLWNYTTGGVVSSSPAVVNGIVYIGSQDHNLYALNASTGALLWKYNTTEPYDWVSSSPAVVNGVVYIGGLKNKVHALNESTGTPLWIYTVPARQTARISVSSSPAVAEGVVYVGSYDGNLYALEAATGVLLWNFTAGQEYFMFSSPAMADGVVYIGSSGRDNLTLGNIYALDAATGALLWKYTPGAGVSSSPAVTGGVIYFGSGSSSNPNLYALDASTGAIRWNYRTGRGVSSSPAVANGVVYFGSGDNDTYALNATTGALLWNYTTGGRVSSSPAVANGVVYFGSYDNNTYALDASTGALLWKYPTEAGISSSPAIVNGILYIGSNDGNVYAIGSPVPPVANFTANKTILVPPDTVLFTDLSTGSRPLSYQWNFGDGIPNATVRNPVHTYTAEGTFNVTLTISNSAGSSTLVRQHMIMAVPPIITGGGKGYYLIHSNVEGAKVYFNHDWYVGNITNGTLLVQTCLTCTPVRTFTVQKCGYFPLTQNITRHPHQDEVIDLYANLTAPREPIIPDFTANVTEASAPPLTVAFTLHAVGVAETLNWSFGDGTYSGERNPVHTYTSVGNYSVSVHAENSACQKNTLTKPDYIRVGPKPAFFADVISGIAPLRVQFTETGTGNPWFRLWNFGDSPLGSDGKNPVHIYESSGTFSVTLTTIDPFLHEFQRTQYIHVISKPKTDFVTNITNGFAPLTVKFTDLSTESPTSWHWDFGDESQSTERNPVHTYLAKRLYTVRLETSNAAGTSSMTKTDLIMIPIFPQ